MATLIIGSWSSRCSECGGNAAMNESHHISGGPGSMWAEGSSLDDKNGCGAPFEGRESESPWSSWEEEDDV